MAPRGDPIAGGGGGDEDHCSHGHDEEEKEIEGADDDGHEAASAEGLEDESAAAPLFDDRSVSPPYGTNTTRTQPTSSKNRVSSTVRVGSPSLSFMEDCDYRRQRKRLRSPLGGDSRVGAEEESGQRRPMPKELAEELEAVNRAFQSLDMAAQGGASEACTSMGRSRDANPRVEMAQALMAQAQLLAESEIALYERSEKPDARQRGLQEFINFTREVYCSLCKKYLAAQAAKN